MWELDCKESWAPKNWCFWIEVLKKTLERSFDNKEIKPVNPKGNQSWMFIGRTDIEAEAPILWPNIAKSQLIGKDPDTRKDRRQEEKGVTGNEMVGWHHLLNGHEFGWTPGVGDGQAWHAAIHGVTKSRTWLSNWTELNWCNMVACMLILSDSLQPQGLQPTRFICQRFSQARILKWVAISCSRVSSWPKDQTSISWISCIAGSFFTIEPLGKPCNMIWLNLRSKIHITHSCSWHVYQRGTSKSDFRILFISLIFQYIPFPLLSKVMDWIRIAIGGKNVYGEGSWHNWVLLEMFQDNF